MYPTGDLNQDGIVNSIDLSILVSRWNTSDANADLNSDGIVDTIDLSTLVGNWGATGSGGVPLASFAISPPSPVEGGTEITLDASGSTGADYYFWDDAVDINSPVAFGTWPLGEGSSITFTWNSSATRVPRLRVLNDEGEDSTMQELIITESGATGAPTVAPEVSGNVTSDTRIEWSWTSVTEADEYETSLDGGAWVSQGTSLSLVDDGLSAGQTRTIEVRGRNANGVGPTGSSTETTTSIPGTAPSSWQNALNQVIGSGGANEQPLIDWYLANTGVNAGPNAIDPASLTPSGGMTINTPGAVIEYLDIDGGVRINAPNVTIRNCIIRGLIGGSGGAMVRFDDAGIDGTGTGGALIEYCTFDSTNYGSTTQNFHAMRVYSGGRSLVTVRYNHVKRCPRSAFSAYNPTEFAYNFIEYLDRDAFRVGHGRAISSDSQDCYIHHNLVGPAAFTGSAAMGMYFDRWGSGSGGIPARNTWEYNILMNPNTDYHWQASNFDYGNDGVEDIKVKDNYWTVKGTTSPATYSLLGGTPGFERSPNYWLDGTLES